MGHHTNGRQHHSGSSQEIASAMIDRLGGLPDDPKPGADEYISADVWANQHAHKAGAR